MQPVIHLLISLFLLLSANAFANPEQPTGRVFGLPVDLWSDEYGKATGTAILAVPDVLDEKGTFPLVVKAHPGTRLVTFYRNSVPPALDFLFSDSDRLFVRLMSGTKYAQDDAVHQIAAGLPYDKSSAAPVTRRVRFLDATGRPLQGYSLRLGLKGRFKAYQTKPYEVPLDRDSIAILPLVFDPIHSKVINRTQPTELYQIFFTEDATGLTFFGELKQYATVPVTSVYVPTLPDGVNADATVVAAGEVINYDGTSGRQTTVTLLQSYRAPTRDEVMTMNDAPEIALTRLLPAPNGYFKVAVSPKFRIVAPGESDIPVHVEEHDDGIFPEQNVTLRPERLNSIVLPKRLSLAAKLINKQGHEINVEEKFLRGRWNGVCVKQMHDDCSVSQCDSEAFKFDYTTGTTFILQNLAVPGRIILEHDGEQYGPVDISDTSPTEIIRFRHREITGQLLGKVLDEQKRPLPGALVTLVEKYTDRYKLNAVEGISSPLADMDTSEGLSFLKSITPGVLDYTFTDADGRFSFARHKYKPKYRYAIISASAPNRFSSYIVDSTPNCNVSLGEDIFLPDVHLSRKQRVSALVLPPDQVPDISRPGHLKPLPQEPIRYQVFHRATHQWYNQQIDGSRFWQFDTAQTSGILGELVDFDVPLHTKFEMGAMTTIPGVSMHVWQPNPLAQESSAPIKIPTGMLYPLQPFYIKAVYHDGTPAAGMRINVIYGPKGQPHSNGQYWMPYTDDKGTQLLFAAGTGYTPPIELTSTYRKNLKERFQPQKLDTSTSVPTVTLRLDPEKWYMRGQNPLDVKE